MGVLRPCVLTCAGILYTYLHTSRCLLSILFPRKKHSSRLRQCWRSVPQPPPQKPWFQNLLPWILTLGARTPRIGKTNGIMAVPLTPSLAFVQMASQLRSGRWGRVTTPPSSTAACVVVVRRLLRRQQFPCRSFVLLKRSGRALNRHTTAPA